MVDTFSPAKRREIMKTVRRERTKPEETLARLLDQEGFVYKQNVDDLPGKPDFVFDDLDLAVFVHGCFWHGHEHCRKGRSRPKSNGAYWREKIDRNKRRDRRTSRQLRRMGYGVLTIWECQLTSNRMPGRLHARLVNSSAQ